MNLAQLKPGAVVLGGAFWLLYHSLWKKQGHCQGGCSGSCGKK